MAGSPSRTFVFIDASNLFYGGQKSLGWSIDYEKLAKYLKKKYGAERIYYFGGIEIHNFQFDYLKQETIDIEGLVKYYQALPSQALPVSRHLQQAKFYRKLLQFGYITIIKPVKTYGRGTEAKKKANCDVDLSFYLMKDLPHYDRALVLSGDGDFLPVLKYLRDEAGKEVVILARGKRTAREIKQFAGDHFSDFLTLQKHIKFEDNKKPEGHTNISTPSLVVK